MLGFSLVSIGNKHIWWSCFCMFFFPSLFFSPLFFNLLSSSSQILQTGRGLQSNCITADELFPLDTRECIQRQTPETWFQLWEISLTLWVITEPKMQICRKLDFLNSREWHILYPQAAHHWSWLSLTLGWHFCAALRGVSISCQRLDSKPLLSPRLGSQDGLTCLFVLSLSCSNK